MAPGSALFLSLLGFFHFLGCTDFSPAHSCFLEGLIVGKEGRLHAAISGSLCCVLWYMSPAYCSVLSLGVSEALILIDLFIVSAV